MATLSDDGRYILDNADFRTGVSFNAEVHKNLPQGVFIDNRLWYKNRNEFGGGFAKRIIEGGVTPFIFEGVGDGFADDTDALQSAFNSGYPVILPKNKTWKYNKTLYWPSNLVITGEDEATSLLKPDIENFVFSNHFNPATIVNSKSKLAQGVTYIKDDFTDPNYNISIANFSMDVRSDAGSSKETDGKLNMQTLIRVAGLVGFKCHNVKFTASSNVQNRHNALIDLHAAYKDVVIWNSDFVVTHDSPRSGGAIWVQNEGDVDCENVRLYDCNLIGATKDETLAIYTITGSGKVKNVRAYGLNVIKPAFTTANSSIFTIFGNVEDVNVQSPVIISLQSGKAPIGGLLRIGTSADTDNIRKPNNVLINNPVIIGEFPGSSYAIVGFSGTNIKIAGGRLACTGSGSTSNIGIYTPSSSLSKSWTITGVTLDDFYTGINGGSIIEGNIINRASVGIRGYRRIINNRILDCKGIGTYLVSLGAENYVVTGNLYTLTSSATAAFALDTGQFGYGKIYLGQNNAKSAVGGSCKGLTQVAGVANLGGAVQEDNNVFDVTGIQIDVFVVRTLKTNDAIKDMTNVNLRVGVIPRVQINSSAAFFAGSMPASQFSREATPATPLPRNEPIVLRDDYSSASTGKRELGFVMKFSGESNKAESDKAVGIIGETSNAFSNQPEISLFAGPQKPITAKPTGEASINGSINFAFSNKTYGVYAIGDLDQSIFADATDGNITLNLPSAATRPGRHYRVKRVDNSSFLVVLGGTVEGVPNYQLKTSGTVEIMSNGVEWKVLSKSGGDPIVAKYQGSGTGASTSITIPHGVSGVSSSSVIQITPNSAAAANIAYATIDATNISVYYSVAPQAGTNNLIYSVVIRP